MTRNPVLILGVLGTVALTAFSWFTQRGRANTPELPRVFVSRDLTANTVLQSDDLAASTRGGELTPAQKKLADPLVGQLVTRDFKRGEAIVAADVKPAPALDAVTRKIPPGLRGLRVKVAEETVVRVGDFVDVLGNGPEGAGTVLVAQRVPVLERWDPPRPSAKKDKADEESKAAEPTMFLLGVNPRQATRIADADKQGGVRFLLRSPADHGTADLERIFTSPTKATPAPVPPPPRLDPHPLFPPGDDTVEVITVKGSTLETVKVRR